LAILAICSLIGVVMGGAFFGRSRRRTVSFADVPLPQMGPLDGPGVTCTCEHACNIHAVQPESMIMGSNFTKVPRNKIPKVQVPVYAVDGDGKLTKYLGVAVRILDWLVVPTHVIVSEETVAMLSMATDPPIPYKFEAKSFEGIEGDLSAMRMAEKDFSKLGMTKANLATMEGDSMVSVMSASKDPEVSFGTLLHDTKVFGGVLFRGSTKGGFSGAAYMIGKQLAGIHLGGGVVNYGMSATYIASLLQKTEATAEWLDRIRRKAGPLKYQRSKFNPDEAIVYVNGRYQVVDLSMMEEGDIVENLSVPNPVREVEVNVGESFPPQYRDVVEPLVGGINTITAELGSKNLEVAEQCSATQAEEYKTRHAELMSVLDEKFALLQSLQDSVSNRYREVQMLMTKTPKESDRTVLVEENEKLKKELTEIKQLKTSANVEASSVRAVPKSVRQALAKGERATLLDKLVLQGFQLRDVEQAFIDRGTVVRVAGPVGDAATTSAPTIDQLRQELNRA